MDLAVVFAPTVAFLAAVAGVVVLRRRWMVVTVVGTSMLPALHPGDVVLARRCNPARLSVGDVIVLAPPDGAPGRPGRTPEPGQTWLVKRVVAVPGEPLPYDRSAVVPARAVVVLGDNGGHDSRTFGPLPYDRVIGVIVRRVRPGRAQQALRPDTAGRGPYTPGSGSQPCQ